MSAARKPAGSPCARAEAAARHAERDADDARRETKETETSARRRGGEGERRETLRRVTATLNETERERARLSESVRDAVKETETLQKKDAEREAA